MDDAGVDDTAPGQVFDTGLGYPAAIFGGAGRIVGRTYALRRDSIEDALAVLDEVEATVAGLYRRVEIVTGRRFRAWAYACGGGLELTPIESGDWFTR